jgi:hypothetical protein
MRFTTAPAMRVIYAASTMLSIQRGTATVSLELHAGDQQLAHGLATSLLPRSGPLETEGGSGFEFLGARSEMHDGGKGPVHPVE